MGRIRTIKPEFPQSESMGRVSRDARLLFVQMWTLADDSGRLRGNSRMLASLLFPYDDDAGGLIEAWMGELVEQNCIVRYIGDDGGNYVEICHWSEHQRIDKPSESKLPGPDSTKPRESSRGLQEPSLPSRARADQGSRTKDQGRDQGREGEREKTPTPPLREMILETSVSGKPQTVDSVLGDLALSEAWDRWIDHLSTKGKTPTTAVLDAQLARLRKLPGSEAVAIIEFSISRDAKNLIENGDHKRNGTVQSVNRARKVPGLEGVLGPNK